MNECNREVLKEVSSTQHRLAALPRPGLLSVDGKMHRALAYCSARGASSSPVSAPAQTAHPQVPSPADRATWFSIIAQVSIHTASIIIQDDPTPTGHVSKQNILSCLQERLSGPTLFPARKVHSLLGKSIHLSLLGQGQEGLSSTGV